MTVIIWSWRAILWSLVTVSMSSRPYADTVSVIKEADDIVKAFDERFEIQASGGITAKRKE